MPWMVQGRVVLCCVINNVFCFLLIKYHIGYGPSRAQSGVSWRLSVPFAELI